MSPRTPRVPRRAGVFVAAVLVLLPAVAGAWGFEAHRFAHEQAVRTLPPPLRALFAGNADYLREHSLDPDLWAIANVPGERPNHFLDLDAFGAYPFPAIPIDEAEHLARHGPEARERGRLPWRVAEVYRELVAAFRAGDPARALERAAVLGHYVADGHVPLHAVLNYDGQLTGQKGVHSRWETELFTRFERQIVPAVRPPAAERVADPAALAFAVLRESNRHAGEVLAADREVAGTRDLAETEEDDRYDDAYYSRLFERERDRFVSRLTAAAHAVGSLWYSAWEDAGRPALDASFRFPYVRGRSRLVLASLDGAGAALVEDAVARGVMPNLARLIARGAAARGVVTSLPIKTPVAHATLFTGAWPARHGVTGIWMPAPDGSLLDTMDGFRSHALRAEPLWVAAARQGLDATTVAATQTSPFSPYLDEPRFRARWGRRLTLIDGYNGPAVDEAVFTEADVGLRPVADPGGLPTAPGSSPRTLDLRVGGAIVRGLLVDDPADFARGLDTLLLSADGDWSGAARLKPVPPEDSAGAFAVVTLPTTAGPLGVPFRLFALAADGSALLLYQARTAAIEASRDGVAAAARAEAGAFVRNGARRLYRRGAFGPRLADGGDGTAEARYLETAALVARQFGRLTEFAARRTRWSVLVTYVPQPDEGLHEWQGLLDPSLPGHDPALAARLRPYADRLLRIVDGHVARLADLAGEDALLALVSDHGMVGADRRLRLNVALAEAGLLAAGEDGTIDLARTRAVWAPAGFFLINRGGRPGGIVPPAEEDAVRAALGAALEKLKDPSTGSPIVAEVIDPRTAGEAAPAGLGGPGGGDLYVRLAPGYSPSSEAAGPLVERFGPVGDHMLDPSRREMHALFVVAGPGVKAGADLGIVRAVDVAPTLCALLGIDPPSEAEGVVLLRALGRVGPSEEARPPRH